MRALSGHVKGAAMHETPAEEIFASGSGLLKSRSRVATLVQLAISAPAGVQSLVTRKPRSIVTTDPTSSPPGHDPLGPS